MNRDFLRGGSASIGVGTNRDCLSSSDAGGVSLGFDGEGTAVYRHYCLSEECPSRRGSTWGMESDMERVG